MNRRHFLGTVTTGLLAAPVFGSLPNHRLPTRPLGRTGLQVPIIGFGSGSRFLMYEDEDRALEALNRAIDLGITYIDTAHAYGAGKSEERVGRGLRRFSNPAGVRQSKMLCVHLPHSAACD